jgi:hypothetical protein
MADTWLATFIVWWWDPETGYARADRSGIARWFIRLNDEVHWASVTCPGNASAREFAKADLAAKAELEAEFPTFGRFARSFCFIRASLSDNRIGTEADPEYEARVRTLSRVEQERLLGGNWKIRAAAGLVFDRADFEIVDAIPAKVKRRVRYWDKAGTAGAGDWTSGTRMSEGLDGIFYVEDEVRGQWRSGAREKVIQDVNEADARLGYVEVGVEQEPGSGGKDSAELTVGNLAGTTVKADRPTGQLLERGPAVRQPSAGGERQARPWRLE